MGRVGRSLRSFRGYRHLCYQQSLMGCTGCRANYHCMLRAFSPAEIVNMPDMPKTTTMVGRPDQDDEQLREALPGAGRAARP